MSNTQIGIDLPNINKQSAQIKSFANWYLNNASFYFRNNSFYPTVNATFSFNQSTSTLSITTDAAGKPSFLINCNN